MELKNRDHEDKQGDFLAVAAYLLTGVALFALGATPLSILLRSLNGSSVRRNNCQPESKGGIAKGTQHLSTLLLLALKKLPIS